MGKKCSRLVVGLEDGKGVDQPLGVEEDREASNNLKPCLKSAVGRRRGPCRLCNFRLGKNTGVDSTVVVVTAERCRSVLFIGLDHQFRRHIVRYCGGRTS